MKKLITKIKNFFLCLKYPFLKIYRVFNGKFSGYSYTWLEHIEPGWKKAFGKQLCKDLKIALKKDNLLKKFRFLQIKEKWGELCLYNSGTGKESNKVIDYYEDISKAYCIYCGKPVRYMSRKGWITYLCKDCAISLIAETERLDKEKDFKKIEKALKKMRLTEDDIAKWTCSDEEYQKLHDSKDWKELWRLDENE